MIPVKAYAAPAAAQPLGPFQLDRREVGPHDVLIEIAFCGVCHTDIHQVRDEWGGVALPHGPGPRDRGPGRPVGAQVKRFKPGDLAGVGCMVDSCRICPSCARDLEQFCEKGAAFTYNGTEMDRSDPHLRRLLRPHRGGRGLRPARPRHAGPGGGGAAAVRRHHHLLAPAPLEHPARAQGGRGRAWAAWATWR